MYLFRCLSGWGWLRCEGGGDPGAGAVVEAVEDGGGQDVVARPRPARQWPYRPREVFRERSGRARHDVGRRVVQDRETDQADVLTPGCRSNKVGVVSGPAEHD
jgi:hypothetical protein